MDRTENEYLKPESEYYNGIESNIIPIARHIFSGNPKRFNSIQLQLDHDLGPNENIEEVEFQLFMNIANFGMKFLFGSDMNPQKMDREQLDILNQYMRSAGKEIKITESELGNGNRIMKLTIEQAHDSRPYLS